MKRYIGIIIFLISIYSTLGQGDQSIFIVDELDLELEMSSRVILVPKSDDHDTQYVTVDLKFLPLDYSRQNVNSIETSPEAEIGDTALFRWDDPDELILDYSLKSELTTYNQFTRIDKRVKFPIYNLEKDIKEYILPSEKIDITPDIINLASELAEGETDLYKVVFNIADWTKNNIEYNLDTVTAEASQKASWVLENRFGVCDELTNLFIAMLRSLGIPARFISGVSYTNSELFDDSWGLHGWAEVYFPGYGWVPFDVTYGQLGFIDGGHIKLRESTDSDKTSTRFEWKGFDIDLQTDLLEIDVDIIKKGKKKLSPIGINLEMHDTDVGFGSYNLFIAEIQNRMNYYITSELHLTKPNEIEVIGPPVKNILLKPKELKRVYWIIKVPKNLNKDYVYTFPMGIQTIYEDNYQMDFDAKKGEIVYSKQNIESIAEFEKKSDRKIYSRNVELNCNNVNRAIVDKRVLIKCNIRNTGNVILRDIDICLEDICESEDLHISAEKEVEFVISFDEVGEKVLTVTAENPGVSVSSLFKVYVEDEPHIDIIDLEYPKNMDYGKKFDVHFVITPTSVANPQDITVTFLFNDEEKQFSFEELEHKKPFKLGIDSTLLNLETEFKIFVSYSDYEGVRYSNEESFIIKLNELTFLEKFEKFFVDLTRKISKLLG